MNDAEEFFGKTQLEILLYKNHISHRRLVWWEVNFISNGTKEKLNF